MANPLLALADDDRSIAERALAYWLAAGGPATGSLAALGLGTGLGLAARALGDGAPPATTDTALAIGAAIALGADRALRWEGDALGALWVGASSVAAAWLPPQVSAEELQLAGELVRIEGNALALSPSRLRAAPLLLAGWVRHELEGDDLVGAIELGRALGADPSPGVVVVHDAERHPPAPERLLRRRVRRSLPNAAALPVEPFGLALKAGEDDEADHGGPRQVASALLRAAGLLRLARTAEAPQLEIRVGARVLGCPEPAELAERLSGRGVTVVVLETEGEHLVATAPGARRELRPIRTTDVADALSALLAGEQVRVVVPTHGRIPGPGTTDLRATVLDPRLALVTWAEGALQAAQAAGLAAGGEAPGLTLVELVQTEPMPDRLAETLEPAERILVVGPSDSAVGGRLAAWLLTAGYGPRVHWYEPDTPPSVLGFAARTLQAP